jgi:hypothetical protein
MSQLLSAMIWQNSIVMFAYLYAIFYYSDFFWKKLLIYLLLIYRTSVPHTVKLLDD